MVHLSYFPNPQITCYLCTVLRNVIPSPGAELVHSHYRTVQCNMAMINWTLQETSKSLKTPISHPDKGAMGWILWDVWATRQIWGIWKLRLAYSPETPNLGQNRWCFVPCDLEIWLMTLENDRASLLCCFKLCATFHSHWWIQTGVTVRKRPFWVKFDDF